jgi:hypothetical protein
VEGLASDNPWNPASRSFWGSNPEKKVQLLYYVAIIGIVLSFFANLGWFWILNYLSDRRPTFHALILLLAVKTKTRPSKNFSTLLFILVIWSCFKVLLFLFNFFVQYNDSYEYGWVMDDVWFFWIIGFMSILFSSGMTFLLWNQALKKGHYGPNANTFLVFASLILIAHIVYEVQYVYELMRYGSIQMLVSILFRSGYLLFWIPFSLLYIYRTEIEPWKDASSDGRLDASVSKDSGISAYGANKLKEAKELLDRGVISEEEFKQIKDDYLK